MFKPWEERIFAVLVKATLDELDGVAAELGTTGDAKEGVDALFRKRKPEWKVR